jgi:hypothetical protein
MIKNKHNDLKVIRQEVIKEMTERKYDQNTINEWTEYIE